MDAARQVGGMIDLHGLRAHEDASWRFSVFSRRKLLLKSRDPNQIRIGCSDLIIVRNKVNAGAENKKVLVARCRLWRMNSLEWPRLEKTNYS
jgi:hypothetical protein